MRDQASSQLTTGEVAKRCSVTPDTVLKWIKKGQLSASRTAGGHHRIEGRDLEALIDGQQRAGGSAPPCECIPRPLRCWEYLSERGVVREACKECAVYRVRANWCFEMLGLDAAHARLFCQTSCEDCQYYQRVRGVAARVLIISSDEHLIRQLGEETRESLTVAFARNAYEASAMIQAFRPGFVVVDQGVTLGDWAELVDCLVRDSRVPGLKIILAVTHSARGQREEALEKGIAEVVVKPFGLDRILAVIGSLPVETLAPAPSRLALHT
jgi:excisionase family DNA binding protein